MLIQPLLRKTAESIVGKTETSAVHTLFCLFLRHAPKSCASAEKTDLLFADIHPFSDFSSATDRGFIKKNGGIATALPLFYFYKKPCSAKSHSYKARKHAHLSFSTENHAHIRKVYDFTHYGWRHISQKTKTVKRESKLHSFSSENHAHIRKVCDFTHYGWRHISQKTKTVKRESKLSFFTVLVFCAAWFSG